MNSFEKPDQQRTPVGGEHLGGEYYEQYNSFFDLEMMLSRIEHISLPEKAAANIKQHESNTFLLLGSATAKNINGVTKIVHHLHGKEATPKDLVTIVDINDTSIAMHEKAIQELDEVSSWTHDSVRERSAKEFPYPAFRVEKGDIRSLPQKADSIDVALSDYTVNYIDSKKDVGAFFAEIHRVLKEKGILYITIRYTKDDQSPERINQGGVEIATFSLDEYKSAALDAGLEMVATEGEGGGDVLMVFEKGSRSEPVLALLL